MAGLGDEHGNLRACSYCQQDKPWINSGKRLKDGSRIYVDEHGARWAGRRCPACERTRVHAAVRCDSFDKEMILGQFEAAGFHIVSRTLPLKVAREGQTYTVAIKRARAENGRVVLESPVEGECGIVALLFESVRICTPRQLERLQPILAGQNEKLQSDQMDPGPAGV